MKNLTPAEDDFYRHLRDTLNEQLTTIGMLVVHAHLKGVARERIVQLVTNALAAFVLKQKREIDRVLEPPEGSN